MLCYSVRQKILYIHNSADIYGASRSLLRLISALDRTKFEPFVVLPCEGPLKEKIAEQHVTVMINPDVSIITRATFKFPRILAFMAKLPLSIARLSRFIKKNQVALVHTNVGVIVSSGAAAWLAGVPHVWHVRDWFGEFGKLWPAYARYILGTSRTVLCPSMATASQFPTCRKVKVIHNGFDLAEFPQPSSEEIENFKSAHALTGQFIVGCVGRIKLVRKGQDTLVKAASLLRKSYPQIRYIIVGTAFEDNNSHLDALNGLIKELRLNDVVKLTGELKDPKPAYASMNISVVPSAMPEPFGGVVLESMCMGIPVIGTRLGGTPEMIEDGKSGLLFEPGNAEQLAGLIEELYNSPSKRENLARAARQRVERCFSIQQTVRQIENVYESCLNKAGQV